MITIYDENGNRIKDVYAYEVNNADMGECTISCETSFEELFEYVRLTYGGQDITYTNRYVVYKLLTRGDNEFHPDWHVIYNGETFRLGVRKPSGKKNTDSFDTKFTLIFHSSRDYLKNFTFMNFVDYGTGNPQPSQHTFSLAGCTITQFISRFNTNLQHYLPGKWRMVLSNDYFDDGTEKTLSFDRVSLWNVLLDFYQNWGTRWSIAPVEEEGETIMVITVGANPTVLNTILEYGKDNGLVSIERNNPQEQIVTRLRGYGSSKNLPFSYFHSGDPDGNNITQGVYYNKLMPKVYRDYVRGYNAGETSETESWAYNQGAQDKIDSKPMQPIDFVKSNESEWGVSYGAIEDNDTIFPTLQGATRAGVRLDEVLAVETVDVDSPDDEKEIVYTPFSSDITGQSIGRDMLITVNGSNGGVDSINGYNNRKTISLNPSTFTLTKAINKVRTNLSLVLTHFQDSYAARTSHDGPANPTAISIPDSTKFVINTVVTLTKGGSTVFSQTYNNQNFLDLEWEDLSTGTYTLSVSIVWYTNSGSGTDGLKNTLECYLYNMKKVEFDSQSEKKPFKETFDIWVRNIWNSQKGQNESAEDYAYRVWSPLATSEEMVLQFSDGLLAGEDYDFKVAGFTSGDDLRSAIVAAIKWCDPNEEGYVSGSHWKITLVKSDAEYEASGKYLPNSVINAAVGNHFFFLNITMPYDPYVYNAEAELDAYLEEQLELLDEEYPNFTVQPSSIFCESFSEINKLVPGNKIQIRNLALIGEEAESFYIQSVVIKHLENAFSPEWSIVITDEVTVNGNAITILEEKINNLTRLTSGNRSSVKAITGLVTDMFLFKNGQADVSKSPTTFQKKVTLGNELSDSEFRRGDMAGQGQGFGVYTDSDGNRVVETDVLVARLALRATEVIINQVTYTGGKQVFSAAGMVVSKVENISGGWRCFFDTKEGTVMNHFMVGDGAFCQRFGGTEGTADSSLGFKTYWCRVTAIGADYIDISSSDKMTSGTGTPAIGDNIAQLGNASNTSRQAALVIDETHDGGGLMTWLDDINGFTLTNKDSVNIGRINGKTWAQIYGSMYVGKRGENPSSFIKWDNNKLTVKGVISQSPSGDEFPVVCWRNPIEYDEETTYYYGDGVTHNGSSWLHTGEEETTGVEPSLSVPEIWAVIAAKGRGISSITEYYCASASSSSAPATGWTTGIPSDYGIEKPFLWNKETVTYTEGDPATTTPIMIGVYGRDGKSLTSITEYYLATSQQSGVTRQTSGWTAAVQTIDETNKYLWNYERLTWDDNGTTSYTYTDPAIIGTYGTRGQTGATGPTIRGPREYIDGTRYCSGTYNGDPEDTKWIDVVIYDGIVYKCNTSHTPTIWVAQYWTPANDMDFVATKVLYAVGAVIENAVIRKLQTESSGKRIEALSNILSMFDVNNVERFRLSGEDVSSSGYSRGYSIENLDTISSFGYNTSGSNIHTGSWSRTICRFAIENSNTEVNLPNIVFTGEYYETGDGGDLAFDAALSIYKDGVFFMSLATFTWVTSQTVSGRTLTLNAGTYTIVYSEQYQLEVFRDTTGDPRSSSVSFGFNVNAAGQVIVGGSSSTTRMISIGANGIVINLSNSFSVIFAYEDGAPNIVLQGLDSGGNIVGLKVDSGGAKFKNGSSDWSLITSGSSGGGVTGISLTSDTVILGGGNSTIRSSAKYLSSSWPTSGSSGYIPLCSAVESYITSRLSSYVSFSRTLTSGTEIGRLSINGTEYILYCNAGGASGDYLPLTGGTLTGDLRLKDNTNYGRAIKFGDGDYAYIKEVTDDFLEMYTRSGIRLKTSSQSASVRVIYGLTIGADANNNGTYMLHVTGKAFATEFVDASDERLKDIKRVINYSLEDLRLIPKVIYTWKDDEEKKEHIGTIAQPLLEKFPQLITIDEQTEMYGVNYDSLAVLALHGVDKLAEENTVLQAKVESLEQRVAELERKMEELLNKI